MGDHVAVCAEWTVQWWSLNMSADWIVKAAVTWRMTAKWTGEFTVTCQYDCTDWACGIMATYLSVCGLDGLIYLHGDSVAGFQKVSKYLSKERFIPFDIHMIV